MPGQNMSWLVLVISLRLTLPVSGLYVAVSVCATVGFALSTSDADHDTT